MDCPSEERLVRMALEGRAGVARLRFDLANRRLAVTHEGPAEAILAELLPLNLGARMGASQDLVPTAESPVPTYMSPSPPNRSPGPHERTID